ncbi:hypothetical protein ACH4OX_33260 [Streptomyces roseolus]|uniref:hypothetical protein n=1 Tax=Streptomyces roseolus TaxID=67358 RepID=UPI0037960612
MHTPQGPTTTFDDDTPFSALYEQAADEYGDLLLEVRSMVDHGMRDPRDSMEMTCAAAETAGAAVTALSNPWSLYIPQDAATVASALFVQIQHTADALAELGRAVGRIAERGEAEVPVPAAPGEPANLADALTALRSVSEQLHGLAARHASTTVRALYAAPGSASVPADAHETVVAVAGLLAEQYGQAVTLTRGHGEGEFEDPGDGFGCGCGITILVGDEQYDFQRGDSEWWLIRESDCRELSDGTVVCDTRETLSSTWETAHPRQLADDVLRVIAADLSPREAFGPLRAVPSVR